ncbi:probable G-protein coupled receptor 139 [Pristis pectinata]|uniref:probable G-protein coupled receptor 139 n=1 Tax=Pristis pectinata TaxID=685728 RepID=UPI00223DE5DA|nr:probable G-protein coupled receptor 139 [Pristis pectinata]
MLEVYYSVEKTLYVIIAIIGVPVNLLSITILSRVKCGLSTCTIRYLVAMATADLMVIITEVILHRINNHYFPVSFLNITPVCSARVVLSRIALDISVWFTVAFTFDRLVALCCQKLKTKYCTVQTANSVLSTAGILLCLRNVPFYFTLEPGELIDNVPWFLVVKPSYYTDPWWIGFDWFDTVLTPLNPFVVILILNGWTVSHILVASRVRKGLRGQCNGENRSDPEMERRRRSVILLFALSGNFILLWMTTVAQFLYYQITGNGGEWNNSEYIFYKVGFLLSNLSCCTNTFIYVATQSKFRVQAQNAVKYPITSAFLLIFETRS